MAGWRINHKQQGATLSPGRFCMRIDRELAEDLRVWCAARHDTFDGALARKLTRASGLAPSARIAMYILHNSGMPLWRYLLITWIHRIEDSPAYARRGGGKLPILYFLFELWWSICQLTVLFRFIIDKTHRLRDEWGLAVQKFAKSEAVENQQTNRAP